MASGLRLANFGELGCFWGRGGGLVDRAADSGPNDPSSIPLGEKKVNKQKRGRGWPIFF